MKAALVIIILGSWGLQLIFPWWSGIIPCLIAGMLGPDRAWKAFVAGLIGLGGLWLVMALSLDFQNEGMLVAKVSDLMSMQTWMIYTITTLIGGITGAMSCMTGYLIAAK